MFLEFFLFLSMIILGYVYPIWESLHLICSESNLYSSEEPAKWLSYWVFVAILHYTLFPCLDFIVTIDYEMFQAISLLIKTAIMIYLNFPQINGTISIYQRFFFSNEQIETMKYTIRKKLIKIVDLIDLREFED